MTTHGTIGYVEFPVTDIAKAADFYEAAFGWSVQRDPENSPGYWTFGTPADPQAGGLERRETVEPHTGGPLVYVTVDDIGTTLDVISGAGGTVECGRTAIGGDMGFYAVVRDPDGNRIGLYTKS